MKRIYQSSATGLARTILLVLAMEADDRGIVAISGEQIAHLARCQLRNARQAVAALRANGDLVWAPGGGRGRPTRYAIITGLSPEEVKQRISDLQISDLHQNSDLQISDLHQNSDLQISDLERNSDHQISDLHYPLYDHDHTYDHDHVGIAFLGDGHPPIPAPSPPAEKIIAEKIIKDPNQFHPACMAYKAVIGIRPNRVQAAAIAQGYTLPNGIKRPPVNDLDRWQATIAAWRRKYANSLNVDGMLDWYHEPSRMQPKEIRHDRSQQHAGTRADPRVAERIRQLNEEAERFAANVS